MQMPIKAVLSKDEAFIEGEFNLELQYCRPAGIASSYYYVRSWNKFAARHQI